MSKLIFPLQGYNAATRISNLSSTIDKKQTHSLTSCIRVIQSNRYITSLQHMENALKAMKNVNGKAKKSS